MTRHNLLVRRGIFFEANAEIGLFRQNLLKRDL